MKKDTFEAAMIMGHCDHIRVSELGALWGRAEAAEAKVRELEAAYVLCVAHKNDAIERASTLQDEANQAAIRQREDEQTLANANALLVRRRVVAAFLRDWVDWMSQEMYGESVSDGWAEQDSEKLFEHIDALRSFDEAIEAHLAGQPAAPSRTEAALNVCMAPAHISPCIGESCWWCKAELARRGLK